MKRIRFTVVLIFSGLLILQSCEGIFDDDTIEIGSFMFWSNFDGPPIDIFIDGKFKGTISTFYEDPPGCDASGCVTFDMEPGTYDFQAIEQSNNVNNPREWNGTITISPNACRKLGLSP
jgi:hypothetical protein